MKVGDVAKWQSRGKSGFGRIKAITDNKGENGIHYLVSGCDHWLYSGNGQDIVEPSDQNVLIPIVPDIVIQAACKLFDEAPPNPDKTERVSDFSHYMWHVLTGLCRQRIIEISKPEERLLHAVCTHLNLTTDKDIAFAREILSASEELCDKV